MTGSRIFQPEKPTSSHQALVQVAPTLLTYPECTLRLPFGRLVPLMHTPGNRLRLKPNFAVGFSRHQPRQGTGCSAAPDVATWSGRIRNCFQARHASSGTECGSMPYCSSAAHHAGIDCIVAYRGRTILQ